MVQSSRAGPYSTPIEAFHTRRGKRFNATWRFDNVAMDTTVYAFLENPTDNKLVAQGIRELQATGTIKAQVYSSVTEDTAGTDRPIGNLRFDGEDRTSSMNFRTGGTYSNLGDGKPILIPGGVGGTRTGGQGGVVTGEVYPGSNLLYEFNNTGSENDILVSLTYSEVQQ